MHFELRRSILDFCRVLMGFIIVLSCLINNSSKKRLDVPPVNEQRDQNVDKGNRAPIRSIEAKGASGLDNYPAHHWNREPNQDADDVEQQVAKGNLNAALLHDSQCCKHRRKCRSNVCSKSHRQHLVNWQDSNAHQWGKSRGGHRAGLHNDSDEETQQNGQVVVHLGSPHDDLLSLAHDKAMQKFHHNKQGTAEDNQRKDQSNDATSYVTSIFQETSLDSSSCLNVLL